MGHEHNYERLENDGIPYIINGLGGANTFDFQPIPIKRSKVRFTGRFGALRAEATPTGITFEFWTVDPKMIDTITLPRNCH